MGKCYYCGVKTDLQDAERPICIECAHDREAARKLLDERRRLAEKKSSADGD